MNTTRSARALSLVIFAFLMALFTLKGLLLIPPSPPRHVASGQFNTSRAVARLANILGDQRPHPSDTPANDAVRDRLLAELRGLGLSPVVGDAMSCRAVPASRAVNCSRVRNVRVTIGPAAGKHLLLNSHYDSSAAGPGAADAGIGVATMLEVAALLRREPLARPVTFLFNEGEEFGLLGAEAFLTNDPLAANIGSLINIEARGVSGPALMFEASTPNGAALDDYARSARRPYANAIMTDMAALIPNSTDVMVFKPRRWKTLSYAIIGNETRYHSPGDNLAALDRRSVYHLGSEVLAAARNMANASPPAATTQRYVFTDLAGRGFIRLPLLVAVILLGVLIVGAAWLGWRAKALRRPLATVAGSVVLGAAGGWLAASLVSLIRPGDYFRAYPLVAYLACYATTIALAAGLIHRWGQALDRRPLRIAAWLFVLIVGAALSLVIPGATIFFLIGPALALAGMILEPHQPTGAVLRWAGAIVFLVQMMALLAATELLLVDGPIGAVAPLAALVAIPLLIEARSDRRGLRWLGILALLLWACALAVPRASADRPGQYAAHYVRDDIKGRAHWAIDTSMAPLPEAAKQLGDWSMDKLPVFRTERWTSAAPLLETPRPVLVVESIRPIGKGRIVTLRLSGDGSDTVAIRLAKDAAITAIGLAGSPKSLKRSADPGQASLRCGGRSCDGLRVELRLADHKPVKVELIATRFALPVEGRALAAARPVDSHAQYSPDASHRRIGYRF